MRRREESIQRAILQHLRVRGVRGLVFFHVPNGGQRNKVEAAIFKGLGVQPGVSDLILLHAGTFHALELKGEGGKQTNAQRRFQSDVVAAGGLAATCEGVDSAVRQLESWRLLRGHMQGTNMMKPKANVAITVTQLEESKRRAFQSRPVHKLGAPRPNVPAPPAGWPASKPRPNLASPSRSIASSSA
jgi:hypothetical protein